MYCQHALLFDFYLFHGSDKDMWDKICQHWWKMRKTLFGLQQKLILPNSWASTASSKMISRFVGKKLWYSHRSSETHKENHTISAAARQNQKITCAPSETQISLCIQSVWSVSSLCAHWVANDPRFLRADSEDSDQIERMPRLSRVFAGRKCYLVGFVVRRLILYHDDHR